MIIYCTTNIKNGKKYIGKDQYNNPNYLGSGSFLKKSIKKHGRKNFKKQILQYCNSVDEMNEAEKYWIEYFGAVKSQLFYNIAEGGNCYSSKYHPIKSIRDKQCVSVLCYDLQGRFIKKFKSTQEAVRELKIDGSGIIQCRQGKTKRFKQYIFKPFEGKIIQQIEPYKLSLKDKKRDRSIVDKIANINRGKKRSKEYSEKASKIRLALDFHPSEETKKQMSLSHIEHNKKYPRTQEHIRNNAEAQYIPIYQFDLDNNFIVKYPSLKHAAEALKVTRSSVCSAVKGYSKTCKGFKLSYTREVSINGINNK